MAPNPSTATKDEVSRVMSKLGKRGGAKRARKLSAKRRSEIARKAGKASGRARRRKKKVA
jgi:general stress protein YciG